MSTPSPAPTTIEAAAAAGPTAPTSQHSAATAPPHLETFFKHLLKHLAMISDVLKSNLKTVASLSTALTECDELVIPAVKAKQQRLHEGPPGVVPSSSSATKTSDVATLTQLMRFVATVHGPTTASHVNCPPLIAGALCKAARDVLFGVAIQALQTSVDRFRGVELSDAESAFALADAQTALRGAFEQLSTVYSAKPPTTSGGSFSTLSLRFDEGVFKSCLKLCNEFVKCTLRVPAMLRPPPRHRPPPPPPASAAPSRETTTVSPPMNGGGPTTAESKAGRGGRGPSADVIAAAGSFVQLISLPVGYLSDLATSPHPSVSPRLKKDVGDILTSLLPQLAATVPWDDIVAEQDTDGDVSDALRPPTTLPLVSVADAAANDNTKASTTSKRTCLPSSLRALGPVLPHYVAFAPALLVICARVNDDGESGIAHFTWLVSTIKFAASEASSVLQAAMNSPLVARGVLHALLVGLVSLNVRQVVVPCLDALLRIVTCSFAEVRQELGVLYCNCVLRMLDSDNVPHESRVAILHHLRQLFQLSRPVDVITSEGESRRDVRFIVLEAFLLLDADSRLHHTNFVQHAIASLARLVRTGLPMLSVGSLGLLAQQSIVAARSAASDVGGAPLVPLTQTQLSAAVEEVLSSEAALPESVTAAAQPLPLLALKALAALATVLHDVTETESVELTYAPAPANAFHAQWWSEREGRGNGHPVAEDDDPLMSMASDGAAPPLTSPRGGAPSVASRRRRAPPDMVRLQRALRRLDWRAVMGMDPPAAGAVPTLPPGAAVTSSKTSNLMSNAAAGGSSSHLDAMKREKLDLQKAVDVINNGAFKGLLKTFNVPSKYNAPSAAPLPNPFDPSAFDAAVEAAERSPLPVPPSQPGEAAQHASEESGDPPTTATAEASATSVTVPSWSSAELTEVASLRDRIIAFLLYTPTLNPLSLGEVLSDPTPLSAWLARCFFARLELRGLSVCDALAVLLSLLQLPKEGQRIERLLEHFAAAYFGAHMVFPPMSPTSSADGSPVVPMPLAPVSPAITSSSAPLAVVGVHSSQQPRLIDGFAFATEDAAFVVLVATVMLQTDLHNARVASKMTRSGFAMQLRGCNNGKDFPPNFAEDIFDHIRDRPLTQVKGLGAATSEGNPHSSTAPGQRATGVDLLFFSRDEKRELAFGVERSRLVAETRDLLNRRRIPHHVSWPAMTLGPRSELPVPVLGIVLELFGSAWGALFTCFGVLLQDATSNIPLTGSAANMTPNQAAAAASLIFSQPALGCRRIAIESMKAMFVVSTVFSLSTENEAISVALMKLAGAGGYWTGAAASSAGVPQSTPAASFASFSSALVLPPPPPPPQPASGATTTVPASAAGPWSSRTKVHQYAAAAMLSVAAAPYCVRFSRLVWQMIFSLLSMEASWVRPDGVSAPSSVVALSAAGGAAATLSGSLASAADSTDGSEGPATRTAVPEAEQVASAVVDQCRLSDLTQEERSTLNRDMLMACLHGWMSVPRGDAAAIQRTGEVAVIVVKRLLSSETTGRRQGDAAAQGRSALPSVAPPDFIHVIRGIAARDFLQGVTNLGFKHAADPLASAAIVDVHEVICAMIASRLFRSDVAACGALGIHPPGRITGECSSMTTQKNTVIDGSDERFDLTAPLRAWINGLLPTTSAGPPPPTVSPPAAAGGQPPTPPSTPTQPRSLSSSELAALGSCPLLRSTFTSLQNLFSHEDSAWLIMCTPRVASLTTEALMLSFSAARGWTGDDSVSPPTSAALAPSLVHVVPYVGLSRPQSISAVRNFVSTLCGQHHPSGLRNRHQLLCAVRLAWCMLLHAAGVLSSPRPELDNPGGSRRLLPPPLTQPGDIVTSLHLLKLISTILERAMRQHHSLGETGRQPPMARPPPILAETTSPQLRGTATDVTPSDTEEAVLSPPPRATSQTRLQSTADDDDDGNVAEGDCEGRTTADEDARAMASSDALWAAFGRRLCIESHRRTGGDIDDSLTSSMDACGGSPRAATTSSVSSVEADLSLDEADATDPLALAARCHVLGLTAALQCDQSELRTAVLDLMGTLFQRYVPIAVMSLPVRVPRRPGERDGPVRSESSLPPHPGRCQNVLRSNHDVLVTAVQHVIAAGTMPSPSTKHAALVRPDALWTLFATWDKPRSSIQPPSVESTVVPPTILRGRYHRFISSSTPGLLCRFSSAIATWLLATYVLDAGGGDPAEEQLPPAVTRLPLPAVRRVISPLLRLALATPPAAAPPPTSGAGSGSSASALGVMASFATSMAATKALVRILVHWLATTAAPSDLAGAHGDRRCDATSQPNPLGRRHLTAAIVSTISDIVSHLGDRLVDATATLLATSSRRTVAGSAPPSEVPLPSEVAAAALYATRWVPDGRSLLGRGEASGLWQNDSPLPPSAGPISTPQAMQLLDFYACLLCTACYQVRAATVAAEQAAELDAAATATGSSPKAAFAKAGCMPGRPLSTPTSFAVASFFVRLLQSPVGCEWSQANAAASPSLQLRVLSSPTAASGTPATTAREAEADEPSVETSALLDLCQTWLRTANVLTWSISVAEQAAIAVGASPAAAVGGGVLLQQYLPMTMAADGTSTSSGPGGSSVASQASGVAGALIPATMLCATEVTTLLLLHLSVTSLRRAEAIGVTSKALLRESVLGTLRVAGGRISFPALGGPWSQGLFAPAAMRTVETLGTLAALGGAPADASSPGYPRWLTSTHAATVGRLIGDATVFQHVAQLLLLAKTTAAPSRASGGGDLLLDDGRGAWMNGVVSSVRPGVGGAAMPPPAPTLLTSECVGAIGQLFVAFQRESSAQAAFLSVGHREGPPAEPPASSLEVPPLVLIDG